MIKLNNNSSCNSGYQYPKQTTAEDTALITFWNGCRYVGVSAKDFITAAKLGFYDNLDGLQDGDVLMFQDNEVVASGLRYDPETDALVYTGKLIADEIEVSTETIFISQRIAIEAFGNSVEFKDNFNEERRLPIYTKISEQGSLGNFAAQVGAEQPITIQGDSSENYTSFSYSPPVTEGQVNASNSTRGHYRFSVGGINARIKVTATNAEGQEFVQFGTEAYPYKQFVTVAYDGTEATETIVEYPGGIYNTEGLIYTTVIETYDPITREISTEPLNILGSTASGVFRAYVLVDFQTVTEVELSGQGDVVGVGSAVAGDIPVYADNSAKSIQTSSAKVSDFVKVTDPLNKQSLNIIANTVDIYAPDDLYNHYFYIGAAAAAIKLKNPNADYTEQDRFQVFNDSEYMLVINDSDDNELQVIQNGQAYEFFYLDNEFVTGWQIQTLRTRGRTVVEFDVSTDSTPTLGPSDVGPLISIVQSGNVVIPMQFTLEDHGNFQTGDVIEISRGISYQNFFFGVFYNSSNGALGVVYPNNYVKLTRTDTSWDIQQDGTFLRTGIRSSTSRNTPLEPDGSSMIPVNGISIIDKPDDVATYIQDAEGHRVLQLDFTQVPTGNYVEKYSRADLDYVRVAYQGKYDDNRVFYPAQFSQDSNGWSKFDFTGYLQFRHKDKETGDINDTILTIQNGRAEFDKQPYFKGDKLATQPFVTDAIDSVIEPKDGNAANSNENAEVQGYTNSYTSINYNEGKIQGPRFGEQNNLFELIKYQNTKYGYLLLPVDNVSQVIGRDVDDGDLELGINFTDDARLISGKYGQDLPTPTDPGAFAKLAFDYKVIAYQVDGENQDANDPAVYIKNNGDSTTNASEAKVMGYPAQKAEIHKTFQGRDWGYSLIRGYIKSDKTFEANIESPYYVASINTNYELTADKQHTGSLPAGALVIFESALDASINKNPIARIDAVNQELAESFEANNDLILAPNDGVEFYLKDSEKDLGYGLNNVSTYFQPSDGPIDLDASTYLDYSQVYAVHKTTGSDKCLMMMHESLVAELWGQSVDGVNKLSMVIKSGAKAALGMVNKTAPTGGVWNYQGFAIDIATTSDNANTTNPTKYLKDDGTEATVIADYARAIYSTGTFKNDGTTLLARGVVNFTADAATPNTFTEDDTSDYFVCSVTIGGGTFNQFKMMPVFMTKSNNLDIYPPKAVLFDDAASAVGELLTICYDGAEEASAIAEAAKTSDTFGEFKTKIEQTTITESI